jgi:hypothetical protein
VTRRRRRVAIVANAIRSNRRGFAMSDPQSWCMSQTRSDGCCPYAPAETDAASVPSGSNPASGL